MGAWRVWNCGVPSPVGPGLSWPDHLVCVYLALLENSGPLSMGPPTNIPSQRQPRRSPFALCPVLGTVCRDLRMTTVSEE